MLTLYSELPSHSKVFIYQSNKELNNKELSQIKNLLTDFSTNWQTHGKPVFNSFKLFNYFICFFVDESSYTTSGCSLDSMVGLIKSIGVKFNIDFFNRNNIAFIDNMQTKLLSINDFKDLIYPDMIVYNNLVKTKSEFESSWKSPVRETWLSRYL